MPIAIATVTMPSAQIVLYHSLARNFAGLEIGAELESITNLEALEDLCLTMHELRDEAALQAHLLELMPTHKRMNS